MNEKEGARPNRMGTQPIPGLLVRMGAPMMLSMIVQALYNVVDSLYVSYIPDTAAVTNAGDKAINALTLAFPVQMLIMALCVGTGVGVNASLSRSLGRGDGRTASHIAGNAVFISICYYAATLLFGLFGIGAYIASQTSDTVVRGMSADYLRVITVCSFGSIWYMCFEKLLQATGKTTAAMIGQLAGALTNIALDPVFIFGFMGIPALGVTGAAVATVIGQCVSFAVVLALHFRQNTELHIVPSMLRPDRGIIARIYSVGAPAIAMQALTSVMTYGMNMILGAVSGVAVTAYGVYYKLQNFIFMPVFGLNNASIPIIAYNYGARQPARVHSAIRCGLVIALAIMLIGIIALQVFGAQLVGCFQLSDEAAQLCRTALCIITLGFLFAGANIILQGACQALGNGMYSLVISLLRMVVVTLPLAWALSRTAQALELVWYAFPAAELTACAVAVALTVRIYRARMARLKPN